MRHGASLASIGLGGAAVFGLLVWRGCAARSRITLDRALVDGVIENNSNEVRRALVQGADPNTRYTPRPGTVGFADTVTKVLHLTPKMGGEPGAPVLVRAADVANSETVRLLLDAGADPNAREPGGGTALAFAAAQEKTDVVQLLLDRGALANVSDRQGWTPLFRAAASGDAPTVRTLLRSGADVRARDRYGCTALFCPACDGNVEIVQLLLSHGADPNAVAVDGTSALTLATEFGGHMNIPEILRRAGARRRIHLDTCFGRCL